MHVGGVLRCTAVKCRQKRKSALRTKIKGIFITRAMERIKIYISGKITGLQPADYRARFNNAEAQLRAKGCEVVSPIKNGLPTEAAWQDHIKADIRLLLDCDGIYMLDNWEKSDGAVLEWHIANSLGLTIEYESQPKHRDIKQAIHTAMNITFKSIAEDSRNRWHVYARMIYAHHCKKRGEPTHFIAAETSHDPSTISYYLRNYETEYKYNPEFRAAAEKVATLLSTKLANTIQK